MATEVGTPHGPRFPNVRPTGRASGARKVYDRSSFEGDFLVAIPGRTAEEFEEYAPESQFCEYFDGVIYMPAPVTDRHQDWTVFLCDLVNGFRLARGLGQVLTGPAVLRLTPEHKPEPDLFVRPVGGAVGGARRRSSSSRCPPLPIALTTCPTRRPSIGRPASRRSGTSTVKSPPWWSIVGSKRDTDAIRILKDLSDPRACRDSGSTRPGSGRTPCRTPANASNASSPARRPERGRSWPTSPT